MQSNAMQSNAMQSNAMQSNAMQSNAMHNPSVRFSKLGWQHFLPPVVPFSIASQLRIDKEGLQGLLQEFRKSVSMVSTRSGQKRHELLTLQTWASTLTYAFVERINQVVRGQQVRLLTQNQIPFLENTCCDEKQGVERVLSFFEEKDPMLTSLVSLSIQLDAGLRDIQKALQGGMLYYVKRPAFPLMLEMKTSPVQNIKMAYAYYLYDMNLYDDVEIRGILHAEEPSIEYRACITMLDKVKYMETHPPSLTGSSSLSEPWNSTTFQKFMQIIRRRGAKTLSLNMSWTQQSQQKEQVRNDLLQVLREAEQDTFLPDHITEALESPIDEAVQRSRFEKAFSRKSDALRQTLANMGFPVPTDSWGRDTDATAIVSFHTNALYSLLRLYPSIVIHQKQAKVPLMGPNQSQEKKTQKHVFEHKYWTFSNNHQALLEEQESAFFKPFLPFLDDAEMVDFLKYVMQQTETYWNFVKAFPSHLFTASSLYEIFSCWELTLYYKFFELVDRYVAEQTVVSPLASSSSLQADDLQGHTESSILDEFESFEEEAVQTESLESQLHEQVSRARNLKAKLIQFLRVCQTEEKKRKDCVNTSYSLVEEDTRLDAYKEKRGIITMYNDMKTDERKVEKMMQKFKLGKWNVGKEVFQYQKEQFDKELLDPLLTNTLAITTDEENKEEDALQEEDMEMQDEEEGNPVDETYEAEDDEEESNDIEYNYDEE